MKKVYQTKFIDRDGTGNCFSSCIASLFEKSLDDVPEFTSGEWMLELDEYLQPMGLAYMEVPVDTDISWFGQCLCLALGDSPRGYKHAVVAEHYMKEEIHPEHLHRHYYQFVHDPHPDGGDVEMEMAGFFIPTWSKAVEL